MPLEEGAPPRNPGRFDAGAALARLEADGYLRRDGARLRTTARWQGSMARAALRLLHAGDPGDDLRVPVAMALAERYGDELDDDDLAELVGVVLPIEAAELPFEERARDPVG